MIAAHADEPVAGELGDEGILASVSATMPWAVSVVFHIAALLVLMFFTFLVVEGGAVGAGDDEQVGGDIAIPTTDKFGDSETPGGPVVTNFPGIEPFGPGKNTEDFNQPAPDLKGGTDGGGAKDQFATIGIPTIGGRGVAAGDGNGVGIGSIGDPFGAGYGDPGGPGSNLFGNGLPPDFGNGRVIKVVFVVDKSGSMFDTFGYVKAELIRFISNLPRRQSYQVIFFSDGPPVELVIDGQAKLQNATPKNKMATRAWVEEQIPRSAGGQTIARHALERAFNVAGGPPNLIYFLTDGVLNDEREVLQALQRLNAAKKVHVNTIMFKDRVGEPLLQKIAQENGGNYKFINESDLGQDY